MPWISSPPSSNNTGSFKTCRSRRCESNASLLATGESSSCRVLPHSKTRRRSENDLRVLSALSPRQWPLTPAPPCIAQHLSPRPLFTLHFSHVLSYVIALEPDKKPVEVFFFSSFFCGCGHRPGSVSVYNCLLFAPTRDGQTGERLAGSPLQPGLTWVNSTASLPSLSSDPTLPSSTRTLRYYVSPTL